MNRSVRSTRKTVSYDEAEPPTWVRNPWIARVKSFMDKWQPLTPKERVPLIEPMWEAVMSSPECVAYYYRFRDTMTSKLYELAAEARVYGVSLARLQKRVFHWLKDLKKMDCYRTAPKSFKRMPEVIPRPVVAPVAVAEVVVAEVVAPVVEPPAVVAEVVVEKVVVAEVVAPAKKAAPPSVAEEIAAMVLHKVVALEEELADRKRAHEEDMVTMRFLLAEKDARIAELEARLQKVADALIH